VRNAKGSPYIASAGLRRHSAGLAELGLSNGYKHRKEILMETAAKLAVQPYLAAGRYEDAVVKLIELCPHTSFVGIMELLETVMEVEGDFCLHMSSDPNLIFWGVVNRPVITILTRVIGERVFWYPAKSLIYINRWPRASYPSRETDPERRVSNATLVSGDLQGGASRCKERERPKYPDTAFSGFR
jgi:hypothetical protein